jgi:hypothetical protein
MARAKPNARKRATRLPIPDEELIARLQENAPDVLTATMPEATFESAIEGLLKESPQADDFPHFYCRRCGEYHLKTHPHYESKP